MQENRSVQFLDTCTIVQQGATQLSRQRPA